jgi:GcrA cell cycle regulator
MRNQTNTPWTDEHNAVLKTLVESGIAYSAIAVQLNAACGTVYTRNACIGRAKRLDLISPTRERAPRKPRDRTGEKRSTANHGHHHTVARITRANGNSNAMRVIYSIEAKQQALRCVDIEPRGLTLIDLEPGDCRYPYGDETITFCGHPKQDGSQYCTPHHHLCWVRPVAPKKAPNYRPYALGAA